jgi:amino acid transporter
VLATSSAISGTIFGASRLMSVIAVDGYFPKNLAKRKRHIPVNAIIAIAVFASVLILIGGLELILEFGSITFLLVSLLMAIANYKLRHQTKSSSFLTISAIVGLSAGGALILFYEFTNEMQQMIFIVCIYVALLAAAGLYSRRNQNPAI